MFMSVRQIYNQAVRGTGLEPVTFPGMGPLREKYVSETAEIAIFS